MSKHKTLVFIVVLLFVAGVMFSLSISDVSAACKIKECDEDNCSYVATLSCGGQPNTPAGYNSEYTTPVNVKVNGSYLSSSSPLKPVIKYYLTKIKQGSSITGSTLSWGCDGSGGNCTYEPDHLYLKTCQISVTPYKPLGWAITAAKGDWPAGYYLRQTPTVSGGLPCDTTTVLGCGAPRNSTTYCTSSDYSSPVRMTWRSKPESDKHIQSFTMEFCSYGEVAVTTNLPSGAGNTGSITLTGYHLGNDLPMTSASNSFTLPGNGSFTGNHVARTGNYSLSYAGGAPTGYTFDKITYCNSGEGCNPTITYSGGNISLPCSANAGIVFKLNFTTPLPDLTAEDVTMVDGTKPPVAKVGGNGHDFRSVIRNIGTGSTVNSFYNLFQISASANGTTKVDGSAGGPSDYKVGTQMGVLGPKDSTSPKDFQYSDQHINFYDGTKSTVYIRACADKESKADVGDITESDEDNNCGEWKPMEVAINGTCGPAAKTYAATATVFTGAMCGDSKEITTPASPAFPEVGSSTTWTCSGTTAGSYTGSSSSTCTATRTTAPVMSGNLSGSSCIIARGNSNCNTTISWSVSNPEVANGSKITSNYPSDNTTVYSGDMGNNKTVTLPYGGRTFYLYNNAKSLFPASESPLGTGLILSASCDTANGDGWDGTKCTEGGVPPATTMSGTLAGNNCTISEGESSCDTTISWSVTNPEVVNGSKITSNYPSDNTTVYSGDMGVNKTVTIPYDSRSFFLYNNGDPALDSLVITANCGNGLGWDGDSCEEGESPGEEPGGGTGCTPISAICGGTPFTCESGERGNMISSPTVFKWDCFGYCGGQDALGCSKPNAPEVIEN